MHEKNKTSRWLGTREKLLPGSEHSAGHGSACQCGMEENDLGYIVDYKRYDADVFTGVNRRTAAVFQFHSAALRRLNKVGCQRYEGDYTRLKQKHAERRARRMAG